MGQYNQLYTPQDSAIVFIDHQPQMLFGVANIDRTLLVNNVTLLANVAKEFGVPAVLTAVETESFSGYLWPQLLDVFPGEPVIERSSMCSWDDPAFRQAIEATGRKNILLTGLWTEVCVAWPAIQNGSGGLQHLCRRGLLRRNLTCGAGRRAFAHGPGRSGSAHDHRGIAGVATGLERPYPLRCADGNAQATGRGLRQRGRILLHDGSQGAAIGKETTHCVEEGRPLN